jgi:flagellar export protein FliJ
MGKFKFRAEAALNHRRKLEDEAKVLLADVQRRARQAEQDLLDSQAREADALKRAREADEQATDPTLAIWYRNWIKRVRREVARNAQVLDGRKAEVKTQEQRVMEAHRAVRALEKLKAKGLVQHATEERRDEQREIDLLGVMQYAIRQHRGDRP